MPQNAVDRMTPDWQDNFSGEEWGLLGARKALRTLLKVTSARDGEAVSLEIL